MASNPNLYTADDWANLHDNHEKRIAALEQARTVTQTLLSSAINDLHAHLSGTGHATLAEMRAEYDTMRAEVAARRIASDFVPCKFCGPTHAEVTDCGWCDGHGRCPSDQMQDDPIACYEAVEKCIADTDAARPKEPT